jgi:ketosteroid isomerase-like protein
VKVWWDIFMKEVKSMMGAIVARRKVRSAFDSLNKRDLNAFLANWADDAIFIHPGALPVSGEVKGKEAIRGWFQKFMDRFPKVNFTLTNVCVRRICACGGTNTVAAEWDIALTDQKGQEFRNKGVSLINLKRRKAILLRNYIFDAEIEKKAWA